MLPTKWGNQQKHSNTPQWEDKDVCHAWVSNMTSQ